MLTLGDFVGSGLVQSILPVVPDLGLSRSDVIAWASALIAVLLVPYVVARLLDIVEEPEGEEEDE